MVYNTVDKAEVQCLMNMGNPTFMTDIVPPPLWINESHG